MFQQYLGTTDGLNTLTCQGIRRENKVLLNVVSNATTPAEGSRGSTSEALLLQLLKNLFTAMLWCFKCLKYNSINFQIH